ncbi:hypothetical protein K8R33_04980 [archaeon]|nr:hypothetical protein [archaeon]
MAVKMIKGLSNKEIEIISELELKNKYFFQRKDIQKHFKNTNLMNYYIHKLIKKGRIIKLNKTKYYLIPIKAKGGFWAEHPFILVDEILNSKDYFIGGNYAKYYWRFIEQIPKEIDVYTTKKQGIMKIFNIQINFRRTTKNNLKNAVKRNISNHSFLVANKIKTKEWIK